MMRTIIIGSYGVTKITISSENRFQSSDRECVNREITLTFDDGTEQRLDVFAAENIQNLTVEIK